MAVAISQTANPAGVAASSTVATYTGVSIGTAAADRFVVVLVGTETASSTPSACTIDYGAGAVAMSAGTTGSTGSVFARAFYLPVPTGITATIRVTYSATSPGDTANHIAVYSVTGGRVSSTGGDGSTDMDSTDALTTGSITIPTDGGFIAVAAGATDTNAKAWANATEDIDADVGTFRFTTATRITSLTTTAVTCTGTSNGEDGGLSYIIFQENSAPTVALSTPADAGTTTDTTPLFEFTGTDPDGDNLTYRIQIDTVNTFDSQVLLIDTFESFDTGKWTRTNSDQIFVSGNQMNMSSIMAGNYVALTSIATDLNLTGTFAQIEIVDEGNQSLTSWETYPLNLVHDSNNVLTYRIIGGNLQAYKNVAGSSAQVGSNITYNNTTHRFLRIRESGGTIYWDFSADGSSWTNHTSFLTPIPITTLNVEASIGTWQAEGSTTTLILDNFKFGGEPLIDRISNANYGFVNQDDGGDIDPFTSGEEIGFTAHE